MIDQAPIILIDALGIKEPGGARTAVLHLLDALIQIRPHWVFHIFVTKKEPTFRQYSNVTQIKLRASKGLFARILIQFITPYYIKKYKVDLVHFTKSQGAIVPGIKSVLTLFDVTTLRHPEIHSKQAVFFWQYIQPIIASHTDAIITISNNAAKDIHKLLCVPEEVIYVIPCASQFNKTSNPSDIESHLIRNQYKLPEEYLLFVGALALKKNLHTLIKALGLMQERGTNFPPLVLVGPRYKQSDATCIFSLIEHLNLSERINYIGTVPENDLRIIYQNATIFLLPSIHEGFGIPALEAMVCKTPIIAARSSAIPEVVGEAGWLVDDFSSPFAWADMITNLLNDPHARDELTEKGEHQASKFSWRQSAQKLAALYEQLLIS